MLCHLHGHVFNSYNIATRRLRGGGTGRENGKRQGKQENDKNKVGNKKQRIEEEIHKRNYKLINEGLNE